MAQKGMELDTGRHIAGLAAIQLINDKGWPRTMMVCQQGGELIVLSRVLWEGASGEPEYSVRAVIWGPIQLSAHLLAWLELSWSCLCLPGTTAGGSGDTAPPPGPSGEGQSDLRDLFSLKSLWKHKSLLRRREITSLWSFLLFSVFCWVYYHFGTILNFEAETKWWLDVQHYLIREIC